MKAWEEHGVWRRAWEALLGTLDAKKRIEWEQALVDATFRAAKKGALQLASRSAVKARSAKFS